MANVGARRTGAQLMQEGLESHFTTSVRYAGKFTFDASPAAQELYLAGVNGARFNVPTDSYVIGMFMGSAWNLTDGDNPAGIITYFGIENDGGTVAAFPTNLRATDGNPINEFSAGVGTWALSADDTNKAIKVAFTGTANKEYNVSGVMFYNVVSKRMEFPNKYGTTT